ncbi:MAG: metallophosphoesterase [Chloroflexota bacterium]|nr:metallophosphoesterase [Chloroflexota bacterium]
MINRLTIAWPDRRAFAGRGGRPIRFLVASDEPEPALRHAVNRDELGQLDGVIGCGDLEPEWLMFLADAFNTPLVYVRGNHDRGGGWTKRPLLVPVWLEAGRVDRLAGIPVVGLEWPGVDAAGNQRRPWLAWRQTITIARRLLLARLWRRPVIVISHVPPAGVGDVPTDAYHVGFPAYRWLLDRLGPPIWLHGHTTTASVTRLVERSGPTVVANATGALLVELTAPPN